MYDNEFMEQLLQGISVQEERLHPDKTEKCLPGSGEDKMPTEVCNVHTGEGWLNQLIQALTPENRKQAVRYW